MDPVSHARRRGTRHNVDPRRARGDVGGFDRSVIDRLTKGNWFENPSNSSISCQQTGPIVIGEIVTGAKGEEVFSQRMSLFFKSIAVRRIYDKTNNTLVYVAFSRQVKDASAKMSLSTITLFNANASWSAGQP